MKKSAIKLVSAAALLLGAVLVANGETWYTTKSDNRTNGGSNMYQNDAFNDPSFWMSLDGTKTNQEFSAEDEYYVHHDLYLRGEPSFPGGVLHIGDLAQNKKSTVRFYWKGVKAGVKGFVLEKGGFMTRRSSLPASYVVSGPITVLSPQANPFLFDLSSYDKSTIEVNGGVAGMAGTALCVTGGARTALDCIFADVSNYHGLITVTSDVENSSSAYGVRLKLKNNSFPGSLDMSRGTVLEMDSAVAGSATTISNMTFRKGARIVVGGADGSYVASGQVKAEGGVVVKLAFEPFSNDLHRKVLVSAPEESADFSKDDFELDSSNDSWKHFCRLDTTVENGVKSLVAVFEPLVRQVGAYGNEDKFDSIDASHLVSSMTNAAHWSDLQTPHGGVDYWTSRNLRTLNEADVAGVFPGRSLTLSGGSLRIFHKEYTVTNLIVDGGVVQYGRQGGQTPPRVLHCEMISVCEGSTLSFEAFLGKGIEIDSEISGKGRLWFSGLTKGNNSSPSAYYILRKPNVNFAGTVYVSQHIGGYLNFQSNFQTLRIADGRCLGGRLPKLEPEALKLENNSRLTTIASKVELEDGLNRGVYIQGCGRFYVGSDYEAETLVCNWPITMNGAFYKEGDGRLELGGTVSFQGEKAIGDVPRANSNLFFVSKGTLVPRRHNCCDGMAISFSKNTKLVVPLVAGNADLLKWGLCNVKEGGSVAIAENLEVDFDLTECPQPPAKEFTAGIVTVANTPAAVEAIRGKLKLGSTTYKGYRRAMLVEDEDEKSGTVTFAGKFVQDGLSITVR